MLNKILETLLGHTQTKYAAAKEDFLPEVVTLFEEIVRELPEGCAKLVKEKESDGEIIVRVFPSNPAAAVIAARGGGGLRYDLLIGEGTLYEIFPGAPGFSSTDSAAEAVRRISLAVFAGRFEETVWKVGRKNAQTIGMVHLRNEKAGKVRIIHGFYPFRFKKQKHIKYKPYCEGLSENPQHARANEHSGS